MTLNGSGVSGAGALQGTGTASLSGNVNLASDSSIGGTGTLTISGAISGGFSISKEGAGTLVLSGNGGYGGATSVNAGTLRLGAANRIPDSSAVTVAAGATFDLNGFADTIASLSGAGNVSLGAATLTSGDANNTSYSGTMSGAGGLTKQGAGTFTLSGANSYTGTTTINAGAIKAAANDALGSPPAPPW